MKNPEILSAENIIVFGGSFNPPTLAHEQIIQACLDAPEFDEVWVMPSGERQDKHMSSTDSARMLMLSAMKKQVFGNDDRLHVADFELKLPRPTRTIRTVGALAIAHPEKQFWFVFGADSYATMHEWEGGNELKTSLPVLLLPRPGSELPTESEKIRHLPHIMGEKAIISSTQVRDTVAKQGDITRFVSNAVRQCILTGNLYVSA